MTDRDKLVEIIARAVHAALLHPDAGDGYVGKDYSPETTIDGDFSIPFLANAALKAIEEAGYQVLSEIDIGEAREEGWQDGFKAGGSCDNY